MPPLGGNYTPAARDPLWATWCLPVARFLVQPRTTRDVVEWSKKFSVTESKVLNLLSWLHGEGLCEVDDGTWWLTPAGHAYAKTPALPRFEPESSVRLKPLYQGADDAAIIARIAAAHSVSLDDMYEHGDIEARWHAWSELSAAGRTIGMIAKRFRVTRGLVIQRIRRWRLLERERSVA